MKVNPVSKKQSGVMLLEALIAILIFAVGILGIVGLQATAIKQGTDARYRSDAAMLANQLLGEMWLGDRTVATLQNNYNTGNPKYLTWSLGISNANLLPGTIAYPPTVAVDANGVVTIQINWLAPSEPANAAPHRYVTVAQIKDVTG
jgi:type IV pilus assembly protein PilV